jgi:integral membrane protein
MNNLSKGQKLLRYSAFAEAVTLVALVCVAVPLKYMADFPLLVKLIGPIHGAMFVLFIVIVLRSWAVGLVGILGALRLAIGSIIPFGGFINERWLNQQFALQAQ